LPENKLLSFGKTGLEIKTLKRSKIFRTGQMVQLVRRVGGMGFKSRADQISHTFQRLATVAILMCEPWHKAAELGTAYS